MQSVWLRDAETYISTTKSADVSNRPRVAVKKDSAKLREKREKIKCQDEAFDKARRREVAEDAYRAWVKAKRSAAREEALKRKQREDRKHAAADRYWVAKQVCKEKKPPRSSPLSPLRRKLTPSAMAFSQALPWPRPTFMVKAQLPGSQEGAESNSDGLSVEVLGVEDVWGTSNPTRPSTLLNKLCTDISFEFYDARIPEGFPKPPKRSIPRNGPEKKLFPGSPVPVLVTLPPLALNLSSLESHASSLNSVLGGSSSRSDITDQTNEVSATWDADTLAPSVYADNQEREGTETICFHAGNEIIQSNEDSAMQAQESDGNESRLSIGGSSVQAIDSKKNHAIESVDSKEETCEVVVKQDGDPGVSKLLKTSLSTPSSVGEQNPLVPQKQTAHAAAVSDKTIDEVAEADHVKISESAEMREARSEDTKTESSIENSAMKFDRGNRGNIDDFVDDIITSEVSSHSSHSNYTSGSDDSLAGEKVEVISNDSFGNHEHTDGSRTRTPLAERTTSHQDTVSTTSTSNPTSDEKKVLDTQEQCASNTPPNDLKSATSVEPSSSGVSSTGSFPGTNGARFSTLETVVQDSQSSLETNETKLPEGEECKKEEKQTSAKKGGAIDDSLTAPSGTEVSTNTSVSLASLGKMGHADAEDDDTRDPLSLVDGAKQNTDYAASSGSHATLFRLLEGESQASLGMNSTTTKQLNEIRHQAEQLQGNFFETGSVFPTMERQESEFLRNEVIRDVDRHSLNRTDRMNVVGEESDTESDYAPIVQTALGSVSIRSNAGEDTSNNVESASNPATFNNSQSSNSEKDDAPVEVQQSGVESLYNTSFEDSLATLEGFKSNSSSESSQVISPLERGTESDGTSEQKDISGFSSTLQRESNTPEEMELEGSYGSLSDPSLKDTVESGKTLEAKQIEADVEEEHHLKSEQSKIPPHFDLHATTSEGNTEIESKTDPLSNDSHPISKEDLEFKNSIGKDGDAVSEEQQNDEGSLFEVSLEDSFATVEGMKSDDGSESMRGVSSHELAPQSNDVSQENGSTGLNATFQRENNSIEDKDLERKADSLSSNSSLNVPFQNEMQNRKEEQGEIENLEKGQSDVGNVSEEQREMQNSEEEQKEMEKRKEEQSEMQNSEEEQNEVEKRKEEQTEIQNSEEEQKEMEKRKEEQREILNSEEEQKEMEKRKEEKSEMENSEEEQNEVEKRKEEQREMQNSEEEQKEIENMKEEQREMQNSEEEQKEMEKRKEEQSEMENSEEEQNEVEKKKEEQREIQNSEEEPKEMERRKEEQSEMENSEEEQNEVEKRKEEQSENFQIPDSQSTLKEGNADDDEPDESKLGERSRISENHPGMTDPVPKNEDNSMEDEQNDDESLVNVSFEGMMRDDERAPIGDVSRELVPHSSEVSKEKDSSDCNSTLQQENDAMEEKELERKSGSVSNSSSKMPVTTEMEESKDGQREMENLNLKDDMKEDVQEKEIANTPGLESNATTKEGSENVDHSTESKLPDSSRVSDTYPTIDPIRKDDSAEEEEQNDEESLYNVSFEGSVATVDEMKIDDDSESIPDMVLIASVESDSEPLGAQEPDKKESTEQNVETSPTLVIQKEEAKSRKGSENQLLGKELPRCKSDLPKNSSSPPRKIIRHRSHYSLTEGFNVSYEVASTTGDKTDWVDRDEFKKSLGPGEMEALSAYESKHDDLVDLDKEFESFGEDESV